MKMSFEKWSQKHVTKKGGIEKGKIEIRKEPVCRQGCSSKVLVIFCITVESECTEIKLMELKFWNGTHTKHVFSKNKN